jgi:outer membrane protein TolC
LTLKADPGRPPGPTNLDLTLADLRQRVVQRNEAVQGKLLDFEAHRSRYRAEYGIYEPALFGSYNHEVNNRKNTAEQQVSSLGALEFHETNNIYESGVETVVPTGARLRLGYNLRDLNNSLQASRSVTNGEYETFFGLTVSQPLLKNFGTAATMAAIRLAAISNHMAFQEYRRELMTVVYTAEATYWNLYLAQEQERFFEESIGTAETILRDNRLRLQAGRGSELEVLEAEAGLGLRRAKLAEARQKVIESINRLVSLYAEEAPANRRPLRAVDTPQVRAALPEYEGLRQVALDLNPDYLIQKEKAQQDLVRLGYARNQRLPELDAKGRYGLNGLGNSPGASWSDVEHQTDPSWFLGVELRVPLTGGIRERNEVTAARLELQSAELGLRGLETELLNGVNTAWHKIQSAGESVGNYQRALNYNLSLLDAALARLEAGKIESRKVLEIEADVLEAKSTVVESLVRYELALLELEMTQGVLLQRRHLEITQTELALGTRHFGRSQAIGDIEYQEGLRTVTHYQQAGETGPKNAGIKSQ